MLFAINGYLTYLFSTEVSKLYGYENLNTIFNNQLLSILVGICIIFVLSHLNKDTWFNRLGATIFVSSLLLLITMLFAPSSLTPYISTKKIFLVVGSIFIDPMLFFVIGSLWLISWVDSMKKDIKFTNIMIVAMMIVTAFFSLAFHNIAMLLMLEIVFFSIIFYLNGLNKFIVLGIIGSFTLGIVYILIAEHRMSRIKSWLQLSSDYMVNLSTQNALHENTLLSLMNSVGVLSLAFVIVLFLFIAYLILTNTYNNKSYKLFTVGVVSLLLVDLTLNVLYIFGLSPLYPPTLYLFGYGNSIVISSSIMIGIIIMLMQENQKIKLKV